MKDENEIWFVTDPINRLQRFLKQPKGVDIDYLVCPRTTNRDNPIWTFTIRKNNGVLVYCEIERLDKKFYLRTGSRPSALTLDSFYTRGQSQRLENNLRALAFIS